MHGNMEGFQTGKLLSLNLVNIYLLTEWEGRTGKYLADWNQMFSRPALPLSQ